MDFIIAWSRPMVGHTTMPLRARAATVSSLTSPKPRSVTPEQCSMPSTPAAIACSTAGVPCAWAVTARPAACAWSTMSCRSAVLNWVRITSEPGVLTPPEAITLMMSAPRSARSATAATISVVPDTAPPR